MVCVSKGYHDKQHKENREWVDVDMLETLPRLQRACIAELHVSYPKETLVQNSLQDSQQGKKKENFF